MATADTQAIRHATPRFDPGTPTPIAAWIEADDTLYLITAAD